jgi:hypothetical protein
VVVVEHWTETQDIIFLFDKVAHTLEKFESVSGAKRPHMRWFMRRDEKTGTNVLFTFDSQVGVVELCLIEGTLQLNKKATGGLKAPIDGWLMICQSSNDKVCVVDGAEWLDSLYEYDVHSRLWTWKKCVGYYPTRSKCRLVRIKDDLLLVGKTLGTSTVVITGGMNFLNTSAAFYTHVNLGSLRSIAFNVVTQMDSAVFFASQQPEGSKLCDNQLLFVNELPAMMPDLATLHPKVVVQGVITPLDSFILSKTRFRRSRN